MFHDVGHLIGEKCKDWVSSGMAGRGISWRLLQEHSQWMSKLSSAFSLHVIGLARSMVAPEITQFSMVGEPKNLANFKIYCTSLTLKFIPLNIAYVKYFFVL